MGRDGEVLTRRLLAIKDFEDSLSTYYNAYFYDQPWNKYPCLSYKNRKCFKAINPAVNKLMKTQNIRNSIVIT